MKEQVEGVDPHLMRLYPHLEVYTPTGSLEAAVRLRSNNRDRILTKWVWGISPTHSHAFSVISSMVTQEVARLGADNVAVRAFPDAYLASGKELSIISLVIDNHPPEFYTLEASSGVVSAINASLAAIRSPYSMEEPS